MENFNAQRARDIPQLDVTAAQESHDVELTFDRPGISRCDAILETESLSDALILLVGCYVGEVLCRTLEGAWVLMDDNWIVSLPTIGRLEAPE